LEAYKQALEANSSHPRHWLSAGNLIRELGNKTEALKYFERAIALDFTFTEVYSNMANIYSEKGEHEKPFSSWRKALP